MSEPKLISPMLDNFAMGDPISDRNGVRCCPAMRKDTDDKYIVKIISIPSSQSRLEALLLSGAYSDKAAALSYFDSLAKGIIEETQTLQKLSQLEGFVPYEDWQIIPMDDESGYDVYLLSSYRNTLQQYFRHSPMTHLGALNLGLDLCSALSACRRSGFLYVDLKPDNIYITGEYAYRIGDIGFIPLDSLKYASLPDRYRSEYTAPEIEDAYAALNTTIDVYALGLILYQSFNGGTLPSADDSAPDSTLPPPAYADYEMAEIILKACSPDPAERWQNPAEMGQALVSYMQRNGAHDTPIIPPTVPDPDTEDDSVTTESENDKTDVVSDDSESNITQLEDIDSTEALTDDSTSSVYDEDEDGNLTFLSVDPFDETDLEEAEQIDYEEVTDEVSEILIQADELIAHPAPDPVIPPEPIDVPIPEPLPIEEEPEDADDAICEEAETDVSTQEDSDVDPEEEELVSEEAFEDDQPVKRSHWLRNTILTIMVIAVAAVGFLYYKNFYLQPIESIMLDESVVGTLTVYITSETNEKKLTVVCSDTYGNQLTAPVENGKAVFTNLAPNSAFTVKVEIDGFHKLTGDISAAFTTPAQTNIVQFSAVTGSEDGSAILGFTIDGPDSDEWIVRYSASDEEEKEVTFSGHITTLTGLTVGKTYDFTLQPAGDLLFTGTNNIQHTASQIVKAEDLMITGYIDGVLTASWTAPKGVQVDSWTVRCYNESGYDETKVVEETNVAFNSTDLTYGYTVEVTASGMSVSQRVFAEANAITAGLAIADTDPNKIVLSWGPVEKEPQGGWLLQYTINGSSPQELACADDNTATLSTEIPGVRYTFTLQAADGTPLFGNTVIYETPVAEKFAGYGVSADTMEFNMCKTPKAKNWDRYDLKKSDYTTEFESGKKASFLVRMKQSYSTSSDSITTLFVIRDENGTIISSSTVTKKWTDMWYRNYCELDIPEIPKSAGKYTISVYFNGSLANEQAFTVTAE